MPCERPPRAPRLPVARCAAQCGLAEPLITEPSDEQEQTLRVPRHELVRLRRLKIWLGDAKQDTAYGLDIGNIGEPRGAARELPSGSTISISQPRSLYA